MHALGYRSSGWRDQRDGGVQPTYDLSVPDNVTYVASAGLPATNNHRLLAMDCDTTEPDFFAGQVQ